jgi:hypothetical protein
MTYSGDDEAEAYRVFTSLCSAPTDSGDGALLHSTQFARVARGGFQSLLLLLSPKTLL